TGQSVVSFNHTPYPVACPGDTLVFTCVVEVTGQSVVSFNHTPYPVACPGDTLVFTCVVEGTGGGVVWRRNNGNNPAVLTTSETIPTLDDFTLSITSYDNGVLVSTATNLSVPVQLNGSTISCSSDGINYDTLTINIAGPPTTPVSSIAITANTNDALLINWSASGSCIDYYNVTINSNNTHNEFRTTNNTDITIDALIIGTNYSFIIIPVGIGELEGPPSSLIQYIWNVPAQVVNISWDQISTDSITIWWNNNEDSTILRPPIEYYIINVYITTICINSCSVYSYNVTDTNTTITGLSPINEYYTVTIIPVNVIGYGPSVTVNVSITTTTSSITNIMMSTTEYITTQDKSSAMTALPTITETQLITTTETISSCADIFQFSFLLLILMATTGIYWCLVLTECLSLVS
uniref:Fibronectin type-III domain-containing protein n=1 Tax=Amphimedon queenslandica TaxID=400682 RepID=A0A1X7UPG8_AMPQE